jgi:predicted phage terminase large subunit-like protein
MHFRMQRLFFEVAARRIKRLMLFTPPQVGKSTFLKLFQSWLLMTNPQEKLLLLSYEQDLAEIHSEEVRNITREHGPSLLGVHVRQDSRSRARWLTQQGGYLQASGIMGSVTGRPATGIIFDDPHRGIEDVLSPTITGKVRRTFSSVAETRLTEDGFIILCCTRWGEQDLAGHLLATEPQRWTVLSLPALAHENDPLGRQPGESVFPERFSQEYYEERKQQLEDRGEGWLWSPLYDQDPRPNQSLLEWNNEQVGPHLWYDELPPSLHVKFRIVACDPSKGSSNKAGDPSATLYTIVDDQHHLWIHDAVIRVIPTDQVEDTILQFNQQYEPHGVIIECNNMQEMIATNVLRKAQERKIYTPIHKHTNTVNKQVRIRMSLTPLLSQKRIHLHSKIPALRILYQQFRDFPALRHDDAIDSCELTTQMINRMLTGKAKPHLPMLLTT